MVKKFIVNCNIAGQKTPVTLFIGEPSADSHPLNFQSKWFAEKGAKIPASVMDSLAELQEISQRNKVSFEELCEYVLEEIKLNKQIEDKFNK